ncbi:MAG: erythromycin esterase family protein [Deltaproteobacteria bacterium]|nr:erythromycin esterase family protein [Deltaproteobacteria bacterium]
MTSPRDALLAAAVAALASLPLAACGDDAHRADADSAADADVAAPADTWRGDDAAADDVVDASPDTGPDAAAPDPYELWPGIHRLDGVDTDLPPDDLAALWDLVGDAQLIGLGEAVHTSGGFYAVKDRLIRDLVAHHGLRVLAMETPRIAARRLDAWIHGGDCAAPALEVFGPPAPPIFGVFVGEDTVALFRWLCAWNADHDDPDDVAFFGFDAQEPGDDAAELRAFAAAWAPGASDAVEAALTGCSTDVYDTGAATESELDACLAALDTLPDTLDAARAAETPADAWLDARLSVLSLSSWQPEVYWMGRNITRSWEARDLAMTDLLLMQLDARFPGQRAILWAHDYHLAADHPAIARTGFVAHARTLGSELRARRGRAYAPVAITALRPWIDWAGVSDGPEQTTIGAGDEALERLLVEGFDAPGVVYDPASTWAEPTYAWELSDERMIVGDNYDAVIVLRESPAMTPVLW